MTTRSKFVVGTVNGKVVSYIVDKPPPKEHSTAHEPKPILSNVRPATSNCVNSTVNYDLEEATRINGSVTLTQTQLRDLLHLLERHNISGVSRAQEAWISSASSCQLSGGEEAFTSVPTTPGPTSNFPSIPVTPASDYDEEPTHDIPPLQLDSSSLSNSQHGVNNSYAKIKAAFTQPYSNHAKSYQCDTNICQDDDASKPQYYSDSSPVHSQSQRLNSSQSESSHDRQPVMKPPLTLLEQKKLKWAKEREELDGLCAPWGRNSNHDPIRVQHQKHDSIRSEYENFESFEGHQNQNKSYQLVDAPPSSLPVITQDHIVSQSGYSSEREWRGGDTTSPLLSPLPSNINLARDQNSRQKRSVSTYDSPTYNGGNKAVRFTARTPGEGQEQDEGRLRWGDKGVCVGHLWEPSPEPSARLPNTSPPASSSGVYPAWLERGLSRMGPSPDPSEARNFLRGQNVPVDRMIMEERERKRQKALEHQNAIKQQLEERELRRKAEREQRLQEERKEEERIRREQELERIRVEQERKKDQEAREAKHATKERETVGLKGGKQISISKAQNKPDKPINLSPRIVDVSQRPRPEIAVVDHSYGLPQQMQEIHVSKSEISYCGNYNGNYNGNYDDSPQYNDLQVHKSNQNITSPHHIMMARQEDGTGMMMLGQEVAVLLAPELEERLLHSRTAREVSTQTETRESQAGTRSRRSRPQGQKPRLSERPLWGAHRSSQQYIKQSDKDKYRQRGTSLSNPPRSQQQQRQRTAGTAESTEDSDRSPPVCLPRRRATMSKSTPPRRCRNNSSDEEDPACSKSQSNHVWSSNERVSRCGRAEVWKNPERPQPPTLSTPMHIEEPVDYFEIMFNPPVRTTSSPPVPAVAKKIKEQPELFQQPMTGRREHVRPPIKSPPVPALAKKIQETGDNLLPNINTDIGNKSAPPALQARNMQSPAPLPDIRLRESSSAHPTGDILSQLYTLRHALQSKQNEWELISDTTSSD